MGNLISIILSFLLVNKIEMKLERYNDKYSISITPSWVLHVNQLGWLDQNGVLASQMSGLQWGNPLKGLC